MIELLVILSMLIMFMTINNRITATQELISEVLKRLSKLERNAVDKEDYFKLLDKLIDVEHDLRGIEIELKYSS